MFRIKIADITVDVENKFSLAERFCRDYLDSGDTPADMTVRISDEDIAKERSLSQVESSDEYLELIAIYRSIIAELSAFGAIYMHACVVVVDGEAYAFAARSGTGKSTHAALWLSHFGDRACIINGDKPIIRRAGGRLMVYGTPWCGKEGLNRNTCAPLKAICFIERSPQNSICKAESGEALQRLFQQLMLPEGEERLRDFMDVVDRLVREVPMYILGCNISDEAVSVAYNAMK